MHLIMFFYITDTHQLKQLLWASNDAVSGLTLASMENPVGQNTDTNG